ncbi:glycine zipper 2TM domain-containing protein [Testudinibacter sp. TR-2022]|uniref:glycine zipper 2TM domain-containing protein n=1 Tax=Testudinibacter sp. TR-2022 TaxID=2585029 RepID=UPI0011193434|nr:glycine zipper 2TM domain-containing protein [Testudinibacter sp. TR-2022]TNH24111.1 glycine zipper 2TM domain-containing protein [Testudinibacter sp. TR-2022]TNH27580.1 glycine zipper 2TM domain-containing protein [Testudinibacter sp. TR-2022]
MQMISRFLMMFALVGSLAGCGSMDRQQRNMVVGAVIGGAAGHLIGGDIGATLGGAALGGVIGSQINKNDRRYYR